MKCCLFFLSMAFAGFAFSQSSGHAEADRVLNALQAELAGAKGISYQYKREMRYFADNYHNTTEGSMYIEFDRGLPAGFRFTSTRQQRYFVYNGQAIFTIDQSAMTIDSSAATTVQSVESNSDVFHSIAMLKNILPLVIGNDTLQRSVADTVIEGVTYTCVRFEAPKTYLSGLGKFQTFTVEGLRRPYFILIDKKTGLPFQFSTKFVRPNDDRDFVVVTYRDININPAKAEDRVWGYQTYANVYKRFVPAKKVPLVKPGESVANFVLPAYTPQSVDSISLKQYTGKVVLLDFWFKSCGPCMEAMPKYNALQAKFGERNFNLLTINVEDGVDDIRFFYNKHKPNYPMLFNGNKVFAGLGLTGCPSSVLIDQKGKVVSVFSGYNEEKIGAAISALLP